MTGKKKTSMKKQSAKTTYPSTIIQEAVISDIQEGELLPGERIMSERAMAEKYNVSRMAVQYAMKVLEKKGYVERRRGAGTFVRKHDVQKINLGDFYNRLNAGITATLKGSGATPSNKVITRGIVRADFYTHKLGLEQGEEVFILNRTRMLNEEPFALEYSAVPLKRFPDIEEIDFAVVSLYDYMESYGLMPRRFNEKLQIVEVNAREAGYLEIGEGSPVYYTELTGFASDGSLVEYTESFIRCDKAEMRFITRV
ncbi:MAG: GntR family transcriptional regulator [Clostridiales bacterium]|nr:GntR family transcriptional regulator [Clostridiales bacterium]